MNLKCCYTCDKKLVCKYYDYDDPRAFAGECRLFYEKRKTIDTQPKRQIEQKPKNIEPKLEVASVADKQTVYVGRKMYRVYQHPNAGWVARVTTVQKNTQFEMQTDLGVKVFYTQAEAQAKAYELNHNNK